jgi:branched-subunit amino acid aminotransferase/4-amino-4-deoxychorismate lyase
LLIEWASAAGVSIIERDVDPQELWDADEVFITSSTRDVHPVTELAQLDFSGKVEKHHTMGSGLMAQNLGNIFLANRSKTKNP